MTVYPEDAVVGRSAQISEDGAYRYRLTRRWAAGPLVPFVMLNPSTADAEVDDPTIRRCVGFARQLGAGGLLVVNLYAYRATKPADLFRAEDPVGPDNDEVLLETAWDADLAGGILIAAWGANARPDRVEHVLALTDGVPWRALGVTAAGAPRHPLYVPASTAPTPWPPA